MPRNNSPLPTAAAAAVLLAGCEFGAVTVADPPPTPAAAEVVVRVRAEEPDAAATLGWTDGLVPGASVTLVPEDTTRAGRWEGITNAEGTVTFDEVPLGRYRARVVRPLTLEEFEAAKREIGGFAGMLTSAVGAASVELEVVAVTSRRRGLVLSEYYDSNRYVPGAGSYSAGGFLEIYNNSDSTIYLDGLVVGQGFDLAYNYDPRPCSMFEHLRNDPQGVWARWFHQFPGSGTDHPLEPGEVAVIATIAINHDEHFAGEPDLSGAGYEFKGGPNNPAAVDLPDIGLDSWPGGNGLGFESIAGVAFISEPADLDALPIDREPDTGRQYVRFPAAGVREVSTFIIKPVSPLGYARCPQLVHRDFDRGYGTVTPEREYLLSNERRVLLVLPDGRAVLQDTDGSGLDFQWADRTPGALDAAGNMTAGSKHAASSL